MEIMSSDEYEPGGDPEEEYQPGQEYQDFKQQQADDEMEASSQRCPHCSRLITSNNPMVNKTGCLECQAARSLAGEIFLFDKGNFITNLIKWFFGG